MIKITRGTYGRVVDGEVEAMTKDSQPFSLSEEREAELVALGVAVKVEGPVNVSKYESMKMPDLRKVAAAKGIDNAHEVKSRKKLVSLIESAPELFDEKRNSGLLSEE